MLSIQWENRGGLKRGQWVPGAMNCLSLTRKKPARGKTKRADNIMAIWTNEWNEKGQLSSMGESRSRSFETQIDEHKVISGMPNTRMPMIMYRKRFLGLRFI